jgi:ELWxxDGT repeat protein
MKLITYKFFIILFSSLAFQFINPETYSQVPAPREISLVADINTTSVSYYDVKSLFLFNNKLYANSFLETYMYDGVYPWKRAFKTYTKNQYIHNGKLYFASDYGIPGKNSLWVYDGENAPVELIDFFKGLNSATPSNFCSYNNKLYFAAGDSIHGNELWMYDSVKAPVLIADIKAGTAGSNPNSLTVVNNRLYFVANDNELWEYDGISLSLKWSVVNNHINSLTSFKNGLCFTVSDTDAKSQLWRLNEMNEPVLISDLYLYQDISVIFKDYLLLFVRESPYNYRIWEYDGINPPVQNQALKNMSFFSGDNNCKVINDKLYIGLDYVWVYDGINPAKKTSFYSLDNLTMFNDTLYYTTYTSRAGGYHLWKTDGINSPVEQEPSFGETHSSYPSNKTVYNNKLYFKAHQGIFDYDRLWEYDGINPPAKISDINLGALDEGQNLIELNKKLYIFTRNTIFSLDSLNTIAELFNLDWIKAPVTFKNKIYFNSRYNNTSAIFVFDGINSPEFLACVSGGYYSDYAIFDGKLYFRGYDPLHGDELWATDGTNPATIVADIFEGPVSSRPYYLTVFKNKLYFRASDGIHGIELMEYDGIQPPKIVDDITPGSGSSWIGTLNEVNDKLYFRTKGFDIWEYDGTNKPVKKWENPDLKNSNPDFYSFKNNLIISLHSTVDNRMEYRLLKYNLKGIPELLTPSNSDESNILFREWIVACYSGILYYVSKGKLWEYDGINPANAVEDNAYQVNDPSDMVPFNNKLYFTGFQEKIGAELFQLTPPDTAIFIQTCNAYDFNGSVLTTSGVYYDTLRAMAGNDSIVRLNLTVGSKTNIVHSSACDSYISPGGKYTWTSSGIYTDTIPARQGCDSIITVYLKIGNSTTGSLDTVACESYISPGGQYIWTATGTYADTIPNTTGCDSIITIHLTVNHLNTAVISSDSGLQAAYAGGEYQWVNCLENYLPITGAVDQSFTPLSPGTYAVIMKDQVCTDTSDCYTVMATDIRDNESMPGMTVFPNPTSGAFTIDLGKVYPEALITIIRYDGAVIRIERMLNSRTIDMNPDAPPGIYTVNIIADKKEVNFKLIKN